MPKNKQEEKKYAVFNTDDSLKEMYKKVYNFLGLDWKYVYILSAGYGFNEGIRTKTKKKSFLGRTETFSDEDWAIIYSIALSETNKLEILENKGAAGEITEEYANTGIKLLFNEISKHNDIEEFTLKLENNVKKFKKK